MASFQFFNNALVVGKNSESEVAEHLYELILELHAIDSSVLLSVLPQLEFKLKVNGMEVLYTPPCTWLCTTLHCRSVSMYCLHNMYRGIMLLAYIHVSVLSACLD